MANRDGSGLRFEKLAREGEREKKRDEKRERRREGGGEREREGERDTRRGREEARKLFSPLLGGPHFFFGYIQAIT